VKGMFLINDYEASRKCPDYDNPDGVCCFYFNAVRGTSFSVLGEC